MCSNCCCQVKHPHLNCQFAVCCCVFPELLHKLSSKQNLPTTSALTDPHSQQGVLRLHRYTSIEYSKGLGPLAAGPCSMTLHMLPHIKHTSWSTQHLHEHKWHLASQVWTRCILAHSSLQHSIHDVHRT